MTEQERHISDNGDLELYALGALTSAESLALESMIATSPLLQAELRKLQTTLENLATAQSVVPPKELRDQILSAAFAVESENNSGPAELPDGTPMTLVTYPGESAIAAPSQPQTSPRTSARPYRLFAIAAGIALLITTSTTAYLWYRVQDLSNELVTAQADLAGLKKRNEVMTARHNESSRYLSLLNNETVLRISLEAQGTTPKSTKSTILWDRASNEVYLDPTSLPAIATAEDYQLWAIVDGKPVDLGVYNPSSEKTLAIMKTVQAPQAFAITIEPKGGSVSPTLSRMIVLGKVG